MARAAAKLIEDNIRTSDGEPVRVVIAHTTIGRVGGERGLRDNSLRKREWIITLSVTPCWCYGSETMDMDPMTIKAVWGLNATERPGAVYLASVLAAPCKKGSSGLRDLRERGAGGGRCKDSGRRGGKRFCASRGRRWRLFP